MASNVPTPLCEREAAEREAAINALPLTDVIGPLVDHQTVALLKEDVAREASDAAVATAAATTSGGKVPKTGRKFSSVLGNHRKMPTPSIPRELLSRLRSRDSKTAIKWIAMKSKRIPMLIFRRMRKMAALSRS
nr:uncharacterized protein LOC107281221 isoform X1 [Oryza sativa Japonica Group]